MNELKIQRTLLRRTFTVSLRKLYKAIELKKHDEIEVLHGQFKDKKERLFEKDKVQSITVRRIYYINRFLASYF